MPLLTISCTDIGSPCEDAIISGDTIDKLMEAIYRHGIEVHGRTLEEMKTPEVQEMLLSNIKQSARPRDARSTTKLDF